MNSLRPSPGRGYLLSQLCCHDFLRRQGHIAASERLEDRACDKGSVSSKCDQAGKKVEWGLWSYLPLSPVMLPLPCPREDGGAIRWRSLAACISFPQPLGPFSLFPRNLHRLFYLFIFIGKSQVGISLMPLYEELGKWGKGVSSGALPRLISSCAQTRVEACRDGWGCAGPHPTPALTLVLMKAGDREAGGPSQLFL